MKSKFILGIIGITVFAMGGIMFFMSSIIVSPGHIAVASLFGDVQNQTYKEGFHLVNPFYKMHHFDARQKTLSLKKVNVPSQDQLTTKVDVSIQWRIDRTQVSSILKETGLTENTMNVHLIPKARSALREQGKSVKRAELFFTDEIQSKMETKLLVSLQKYLLPKGIVVDAVLLREFELPTFIMKAIKSKKEREQQAERQKAELIRFRTEKEQMVVEAMANRKAAEEFAKQKVILAKADAEKRVIAANAEGQAIERIAKAKAYQIQVEGESLKKNPEILQLEKVKVWNGQVPRVLITSSNKGTGMLLNLPMEKE